MNEVLAPKPEVVHLPTLFRRIRSGAIRVPAFQREFVWKEHQVLALLASVYQGFPIGSILLWRVEHEILRVQTPEVTAFPDLPLSFPLSFVLDGMQRLSTLYGVCNYEGDPRAADKFNVLFDLNNDDFVHYDHNELPANYVPLSSLFSPKKLMEFQIGLVDQPNSTELLDKVVSLHSKFQEYLVPTVTIEEQNVNKVVSIFERVNNTGTKLSSVDFMRAVTWSDDFDLTYHIRRLQQVFKEQGFDVGDDTIVKALGIANGLDPLPDILLNLRDLSARKLQASIDLVESGLRKVFIFIEDNFSIYGSDYVPYEGQILVLFNALLWNEPVNTSQTASLVKWFWTTGFNETLRGKPDNFVARTIKSVIPAMSSPNTYFGRRLQISSYEFRTRRFIRGKALSATLAAMFAKSEARSLITGEVIPPRDYMSSWNVKSFVPVVSASTLKFMSADDLVSGRILCNIFVASVSDTEYFAVNDPAMFLTKEIKWDDHQAVFSSQFISEDAVKCLKSFDVDGFLDARSETLFAAAQGIIETSDDIIMGLFG